AARRKDEFLAMLAHELRNPLAPISAAAELMGLVQLDGERLRHTSQVIMRQVRHMTDLVDDLLDVSRVTRGLVSIVKSPQDLHQLVANAVEQVRPIIKARRHQLTVALSAQPANVAGDSKRLVQMITNLLNNAAKYTAEGGEIGLAVESTASHVTIAISDNGMGIPANLQAHVFELFAQAERTPDRSQGGLGLGLALVRSLAELHDGSVICQSDGAGCGSTFTLTLPRLADDVPLPERRKSLRTLVRAEKSLKVLVVDDNLDAAGMLAMYLEALGHEVCVENDARQAILRAGVFAPQLCLLDIGLPGMDGNELARTLRQLPETASASMIAVTGYGQEHDRARALEPASTIIWSSRWTVSSWWRCCRKSAPEPGSRAGAYFTQSTK
ncbi:MAG: hybrid sensor histidine kinase/response regulator, partial [Janthinobacterium lividum]